MSSSFCYGSLHHDATTAMATLTSINTNTATELETISGLGQSLKVGCPKEKRPFKFDIIEVGVVSVMEHGVFAEVIEEST